MGVVGEVLPRGVVGNVEKLTPKVTGVPDAMLVIAAVPNLPMRLIACCKGVASLDELDAFGSGLVNGRSNQNVHMIGHDDESMKLEASLSAIAEKCVKKEFGVV
jgi:hypothetical protein